MKYIIIILAFLLSGCTPEYSPTKCFVVTGLDPGEKGVFYRAKFLNTSNIRKYFYFHGEIGEYNIGDTLLMVKKNDINQTK